MGVRMSFRDTGKKPFPSLPHILLASEAALALPSIPERSCWYRDGCGMTGRDGSHLAAMGGGQLL